MNALLVSRALFACFLLNEAIVLARTPPEERKRLILPRAMPLPVVILLLPFAFVWELADGAGWGVVALQALGLALLLGGELQLSLARSFSVTANLPARPQTRGLYRGLENPIYVGILLQLAAWASWMPVVLITVALQLESFRRMVREERKYLAQLGVAHRGADSFLWN